MVGQEEANKCQCGTDYDRYVSVSFFFLSSVIFLFQADKLVPIAFFLQSRGMLNFRPPPQTHGFNSGTSARTTNQKHVYRKTYDVYSMRGGLGLFFYFFITE